MVRPRRRARSTCSRSPTVRSSRTTSTRCARRACSRRRCWRCPGPGPRSRAPSATARDSGLNLKHLQWSGDDDLISALDHRPRVPRRRAGARPAGRRARSAIACTRTSPCSPATRLDALALRLGRRARARSPRYSGYLLSPRAISILLDGRQPAGDPITGRPPRRRARARRSTSTAACPCHGDQQRLLEGNRRMLEGLKTSYRPALDRRQPAPGPGRGPPDRPDPRER